MLLSGGKKHSKGAGGREHGGVKEQHRSLRAVLTEQGQEENDDDEEGAGQTSTEQVIYRLLPPMEEDSGEASVQERLAAVSGVTSTEEDANNIMLALDHHQHYLDEPSHLRQPERNGDEEHGLEEGEHEESSMSFYSTLHLEESLIGAPAPLPTSEKRSTHATNAKLQAGESLVSHTAAVTGQQPQPQHHEIPSNSNNSVSYGSRKHPARPIDNNGSLSALELLADHERHLDNQHHPNRFHPPHNNHNHHFQQQQYHSQHQHHQLQTVQSAESRHHPHHPHHRPQQGQGEQVPPQMHPSTMTTIGTEGECEVLGPAPSSQPSSHSTITPSDYHPYLQHQYQPQHRHHEPPAGVGGGERAKTGEAENEGGTAGEGGGQTTECPRLKEREEIARYAYKTWLTIKPGHKEIKDRWWALYYSKIHPQYHLRDNYLGRKINTWIDEDLEPLKQQYPEKFMERSRRGGPGRPPKARFNQDGMPAKRRKPNSSKEGSLPVYLNVELIDPSTRFGCCLDPSSSSPSSSSWSSSSSSSYSSSTESLPDYVAKLAACCVDGNVHWTKDKLDLKVAWFKENRKQIMEGVPTLPSTSKKKKIKLLQQQQQQQLTLNASLPKKRKADHSTIQQGAAEPSSFSSDSPFFCSTALGTQRTLPSQHQRIGSSLKSDAGHMRLRCDVEWIRTDIWQASDAYLIEMDIPGIHYPDRDLLVQTDGNKLVIKGERKSLTSTLFSTTSPSSPFCASAIPNNATQLRDGAGQDEEQQTNKGGREDEQQATSSLPPPAFSYHSHHLPSNSSINDRKEEEEEEEEEEEQPGRAAVMMKQRPLGSFNVEVALPPDADTTRTEQIYSSGVLSIKVPLKNYEWRTLNVLHLS